MSQLKRSDIESMAGKKIPTWSSDRSLELLVQWLCSQGTDYATRPKLQLSSEANAFLKTKGIAYRSDNAVVHKIRCLEKAVRLARNMLAEKEVERLEDCSPRMRRSILQVCLYFQELDAVLPKTRTDEARRCQRQRPPAPNRSPADPHRETKRTRVEPEETKPSIATPLPKPKHRESQVPRVTTPVVNEQGQRAAFKEECLKLRLGAARDLEIIVVKTERALARKELLDAGVAREDVEKIFPFKQLVSLW